MKKFWPVIAVFLLTVQACSGNGGNNQTGSNSSDGSGFEGVFEPAPADLGTPGMSLEELGPFHARFVITFNGSDDYTYQVDTRFDGAQVEYALAIDGVEPAQNPGDVRLVNQDGVNQMRGAGTDRECVQFPDDFETGVMFLSPLDLIDPETFSEEWNDDGETTIAERQAASYSAEEKTYSGWRNVAVSYAVDQPTEALLYFEFDARGADPLFDAGEGRIEGLFEVLEVGSQHIEPIQGCEIEFPLPDDAGNILIFPGLVVFETALGPVKLDTFYRQELVAELGWEREEPVTGANRESVLSYFTNGRRLDLHVEAIDPQDFSLGFKVEVFIEDN